MRQKLPIVPTILVALAVATMIGLGIWQLERRKEKEALLATYAAAVNKPPMGWPSVPPKEPLPLFRWPRPTVYRLPVSARRRPESQGRARLLDHRGLPDRCRRTLAGELGWTKDPNAGRAIAAAGQRRHRARPVSRMRLVAASPGPA